MSVRKYHILQLASSRKPPTCQESAKKFLKLGKKITTPKDKKAKKSMRYPPVIQISQDITRTQIGQFPTTNRNIDSLVAKMVISSVSSKPRKTGGMFIPFQPRSNLGLGGPMTALGHNRDNPLPRQGRTPHVMRPEIRKTYHCGNPACSAIGNPRVMYNIACNPSETSEDELIQLVRCRSCAERYAQRKGKLPGEPKSGVFPLSLTLRSRQETGVIVPVIFYCATPGCVASGEPRRMFNLSCEKPVMAYGGEEFLSLIRCRRCAEAVASRNGRTVGEHASGTYPLIHTLKRMPWYEPDDPESRNQLEHIIWHVQRQRTGS